MAQISLYMDAANQINRRNIAYQAQSVMIAIAGAFGEDVQQRLKDLAE